MATTLIIHAPEMMFKQERKKSFVSTLESGVGEGYAIPKAARSRLAPGCKVVVLNKDRKPPRRAEGTLVGLVPNGQTRTGMQRYDVHIQDLKEVSYKNEPLGRTGVSVLEE